MSSIGKIRRLLVVLERLQSGRPHSTGELAELCRVSRRTVFRDLKTLQEAGINVLYDAPRRAYWIPSHTFLPPTELTLAETLSLLVLAQEAGRRHRGIPFQEAARDASLKLQSNLPAHLTPYVSELTNAVCIQTEPQADLDHGQVHYERILDAVTSRKKVRLTYESLFEQTTIRTLLSPYKVLFRRHAWYVIGRSSLHRSVRTFHVGRIVDSELTEDRFEVPPRFNLKTYFGNAWNLIREPKARTKVCVRFQPLVARNVAEVCWHPTQSLRWNDDGTLDFTVTVDGVHEISWWILSYGDQAEVLEPDSLRELVLGRVRNLLNRYRKRSTKRSASPTVSRRRKKAARSSRRKSS